MSHWNYRMVKVTYPAPKSLGLEEPETGYEIREVYYNEDESIYAMSKDGMAPWGDTVEELKENIELMKEAFNAPVIDEATVVFVDHNPPLDCECGNPGCDVCAKWRLDDEAEGL